MPPRDLPAYVHDVVQACRRVRVYAEGFDLDRFLADDRTRDAIERQLLIVGEAVNHIRRLDGAVAGSLGSVDRIVAFRNVLVHGYYFVEPRTVWQIVDEHVPLLLVEAERVLSGLPPPEEVQPEH